MNRAALMIGALLTCGIPLRVVSAQRSSSETPQDVVRGAFRRLEQGNWRDAADLIHAESLNDFRAQYLNMLRGEERSAGAASSMSGGATVGTGPVIPPHDTLEPLELACLQQVLGDIRQAGTPSPASLGFARVSTLAELGALPSKELLARWLEGHWSRHEASGESGMTTLREVIGEVPVNPTLSYVVYRLHNGAARPGTVEQVEAIMAKRTSVGWRIFLNNDLLAYQGMGGSTEAVMPRNP